MERYFIVFYMGTDRKGDKAVGMCTVTTTGGYLNRKETTENIIAANMDIDIRGVIFTGIVEVSRSEFADYNRE